MSARFQLVSAVSGDVTFEDGQTSVDVLSVDLGDDVRSCHVKAPLLPTLWRDSLERLIDLGHLFTRQEQRLTYRYAQMLVRAPSVRGLQDGQLSVRVDGTWLTVQLTAPGGSTVRLALAPDVVDILRKMSY